MSEAQTQGLFKNDVEYKPDKKVVLEQVIPSRDSFALEMTRGQFLRVIDVMGKQVSDLVAFNRENYKERLAAYWTRTRNYPKKIPGRVTVGDVLYSSRSRPLMTITQDTPVPGGIHDISAGMCNRLGYEKFGWEFPQEGGCWELLSKAVEPYGIAPEEVPQPFNPFMNTSFDPETGELMIDEPVSRPGDFIELRAEMDCLVALTVCPFHGPCNGWVITPLKVQVLE